VDSATKRDCPIGVLFPVRGLIFRRELLRRYSDSSREGNFPDRKLSVFFTPAVFDRYAEHHMFSTICSFAHFSTGMVHSNHWELLLHENYKLKQLFVPKKCHVCYQEIRSVATYIDILIIYITKR
jgi:hypothetical protein